MSSPFLKLFLFPLAAQALTAANAKPTVTSGTPATAIGAGVVFTFTARDADGASDIARVYFLIGAALQGACYGRYDVATNQIFLYNDAGLNALGPLIPAGSIANSQCSIAEAGVVKAGNELTLTLPVVRKPAYALSEQAVYLWARDKASTDSGWVKTGTWQAVPAIPPPVPGAEIRPGFGIVAVAQPGQPTEIQVDSAVIAYWVQPPAGPGPCEATGRWAADSKRFYFCAPADVGFRWAAVPLVFEWQ